MRDVLGFFLSILGPEKNYYGLALIYGVGVAFLSLALPVSVQMLINTVVNTGLTTPLVVLSLSLLVLLVASGLLNALRIHLMDLFSRRIYARLVAEVALRAVYAVNPFFDDQNKGSLFNRYFDIMIVQRVVPYLLVGGFTILLQGAVGFLLVSVYHPMFLVFNLLVIALIWLIWLIWGGAAIRSAVQVSHKKHAAAAWLEGLGASNGFFKSERHIDHALTRSDEVTGEYMAAHVHHFHNYFSQTVCFLILYAVASASLLGLGGWLVIAGELTLGQLVAAELVLSVVFYGLSQLGTYLHYFYELCGALDELALFYAVEQEDRQYGGESFTGSADIVFAQAKGGAHGQTATLDFAIPHGARVLAAAEVHSIQREFNNFLKRHSRPVGGYVTLGGQDIQNIQVHELRQRVIVLARPNMIEMTLREYLRLSAGDATSTEILHALALVGLEDSIAQLELGLDTRMAVTGWPLSISETMQLKLAAAVIAKPKVLVLGQVFDTMTDANLRRSLDHLQQQSETTVVYFTNKPRELGSTHYLYLGRSDQVLTNSLAEFVAVGADAGLDVPPRLAD